MNHCAGIWARAPLYLSGEMEPEEHAAFEAHLANCPACAAKLAADRNLDAALRSALGDLPDAGRLEQVLQRKISADRKRRHLAWAGAIAASLALLAGGVFAWARWTGPPQWYTDAALDHRTEVIEGQPRHWRSGDAEIAELAAKTGLQPGQMTALGAAGYRLERAKICGIGGRRMLHLVFTNGRQRYSVFVSAQVGPVQTARAIQRGAEQVAGFETGHYRGVVVSEGSAVECAELAQAAAGRL